MGATYYAERDSVVPRFYLAAMEKNREIKSGSGLGTSLGRNRLNPCMTISCPDRVATAQFLTEQ